MICANKPVSPRLFGRNSGISGAVYSRAARAPRRNSADLENFFLFGFRGLIEFLDIAVGQLLHLVVAPPVVILGDLLVLRELLDVLVRIPPDVPECYPMIFGHAMKLLHQFPAALFIQW